MNIHDLYRPFLKYFRTKRMEYFQHQFSLKAEDRVLDVGGNPFNWSLLEDTTPEVTFLNIYPSAGKESKLVIADGRYLPFKDNAFDIVYSNSVIEHLGDYESQQMMAKEIIRVGNFFYVQTPNRNFFMEPHLLTPFIHFLPKQIRRKLLRNFTVWGWITRPSQQVCDDLLQEIRLLNEKEMKCLFPDTEIWKERFVGLTKSLMAVKNKEQM